MNAGELRHRFHLHAPQDTPDGAGGVTRDWVPEAAFWGSLRPAASGERVFAAGVELAVSHRVRLRWRGDIDGTRRLVMGERVFAILGIADPDERGQWLDLMVEEVRA